jgi:HTH-type transcriptional regulator/antitoxin HigA
MIKALSEGLNIPIKSLLKDNKDNNLEEISCWDKKTLKKMKERNYFGKVSQITDETLRKFFSVIDTSSLLINGIPRKSNYRATPLTDKKALLAWSTLIIKKAQQVKLPKKYQPGSIDELFLKNLLQLSMQRNGPLEAIKELNKKGVVVVVEPHLPKTHLDGILILKDRKKPIIGLTLRYDRLDYFWFTLMHELSHLILHYNEDIDLFYDEIEGIRMANLDKREKEADSLAQEIILPEEKWEISPAKIVPSEMAAKSLARELKIHESIIAGQIRHRGNNYKFLSKVVNKEKIRKYFYQ